MKRKRLGFISIPKGLTLSILITIIMVFTTSVFAQSAKPAPSHQLKVVSFGIEERPSTRLEVESIPINNNLRPTEIFVYRPELGDAPKAGNQYEHYKLTSVKAKAMFVVLEVTNESAKTIQSIEWDYTYPHFKGDKVISHLKTTSRLKIDSGQTATLSKQLPTEPGCGINWIIEKGLIIAIGKSCGRKTRKTTGMHRVDARLLQIKYEDGTVWKAQP